MLEKDEIKHIASLARIGLREKEIEKYRKELSVVLDYFKKLNDLETEKIAPIGHITGTHSVFREDRIKECDIKVKNGIIKNAPDKKDGNFKVKSIF